MKAHYDISVFDTERGIIGRFVLCPAASFGSDTRVQIYPLETLHYNSSPLTYTSFVCIGRHEEPQAYVQKGGPMEKFNSLSSCHFTKSKAQLLCAGYVFRNDGTGDLWFYMDKPLRKGGVPCYLEN